MRVLTIIAIAMLVAVRLLMLLSPRLTVKSNFLPKNWQRWLLGDPGREPPHPDNII